MDCEHLKRGIAWAIDRLSVDGGLTTDETVATIGVLKCLLDGRECEAAYYDPPKWTAGGKAFRSTT